MKKIGVIGLGNIAKRHRINLKTLYPEATIYAMSAREFECENIVSDCDEVVENLSELIKLRPEIVVVASPAPFHVKHAIPLIEVGIPTLIEKPVTSSKQDSELLQKVVNKNSTPVVVGYCLRYLSSSIKMKSLLNENALGVIYNAFIEIGQYLPDWRPNKNFRETVSANKHLGGGALLELSHELDYAQWFFGELEVEHAILRSSKELNLGVEDLADITLTNRKGMVCNIHLDFLQRSASRKCTLIGSKGRIDWDLVKNSITLSNCDGEDILYAEPSWDKNKMYLTMLREFVAKIEGRPHHIIGVDDAVKTVQLIEAIKSKASWSC